MFADFCEIAFDEILNKMGKWKWMHGGYFDMPITLRLPTGMLRSGPSILKARRRFHAQSRAVRRRSSTPYDAKGLLKQAIRGNDPYYSLSTKGSTECRARFRMKNSSSPSALPT